MPELRIVDFVNVCFSVHSSDLRAGRAGAGVRVCERADRRDTGEATEEAVGQVEGDVLDVLVGLVGDRDVEVGCCRAAYVEMSAWKVGANGMSTVKVAVLRRRVDVASSVLRSDADG